MTRKYEEGGHQAAIFEWATLIPVPEGGKLREYMWANAYEANRGVIGGARMQKRGLSSGIPDITICLPRKKYHGMYLELKRSTEYKITAAQHTVIDRLNRVGYCARVSSTIDRSIEMIEEYLS